MAEESAPQTVTAAPSHEDISRLAHAYWEARGARDGTAVEDWLRAERDLREPNTGIR
jgi:hypothetical protein